MVVQWIVLVPHSTCYPTLIVFSGYCFCEVSHVPISLRFASRFTGGQDRTNEINTVLHDLFMSLIDGTCSNFHVHCTQSPPVHQRCIL